MSSSAKYLSSAWRAPGEPGSTRSISTVAAREQPVGGGQCRGQLGALSLRQRVDELPGDVVGASVQALPFAPAGGGEHDDPLSPVLGIGVHRDEVLLLELSEQAADVAGVQTEPAAEVAHPGALRTDLEQQA